eukprot:TRINITY_DN54529_c1_g2_i1.p1 TRINITY_DN54529_c1_g2~~TRINITY_DN54529_c1_g2_i1.p1  ORF type:complete len:496 (-),score=73.39 TRINITY_DN54529_c1_g2_i1:396-1883(-)
MEDQQQRSGGGEENKSSTYSELEQQFVRQPVQQLVGCSTQQHVEQFSMPALPITEAGFPSPTQSPPPYSVMGVPMVSETMDALVGMDGTKGLVDLPLASPNLPTVLDEKLDQQLVMVDKQVKPEDEIKPGQVLPPKLLEKEVPGSTWKYKRLEVYHEKEIASVAHQLFPEQEAAEAALEFWQAKMFSHDYQGSKSEPAVMRLLHEPSQQWQVSLSLGIKSHGTGEPQEVGNGVVTPQKRSYVLKICRLSDFMTKVHLQAGDRFCLYPGNGKVAIPKDEDIMYLPEFFVEVQRGPILGAQTDEGDKKRKRRRVKKETGESATPQHRNSGQSAGNQASVYNPIVGTNQVSGANALPIIFSSVRRSGYYIDCFISSIPKFELGNSSVIVPQDGRSIKIRAQWSGLTQLVDQSMMSVSLGDLQLPSNNIDGPWSMAHQHEINLDQFLQSNEMVTTNLQYQLDENTSWLVIRVPTIATDQIMLMNNQSQSHHPLQQQLPM